MKEVLDKLDESHQKHRDQNYNYHEEGLKHWRAWGSWFSWGSPVGLGLFYTLIILSTGVFIWLLHVSK